LLATATAIEAISLAIAKASQIILDSFAKASSSWSLSCNFAACFAKVCENLCDIAD
jgi:hypothetical protein